MVVANESLAVVLANPRVRTCQTHVKHKQKSQETNKLTQNPSASKEPGSYTEVNANSVFGLCRCKVNFFS